VTILAHDASTKKHLGYTKVGRVAIGRDVFLGAGAIILPGVSIGDGAIVGAGSVVTKDIPAGAVAVGNPATIVASVSELIEKHKSRLAASGVYGEESLPISRGLNQGQKETLRAELADRMGYVA
jgi:maltose O-acetyltransferase